MKIERVLVVGFGSMGARHLRLARSLLPAADIRVLRRSNEGSVPEGANAVLADLAQATAFAPQLAVIASPATMHLPVARALAESGAHLLVEKPLAAGTEGVAHLLQVCSDRARVLLVGYNLRFLATLRCFRDALHQGLVGEVLSVRCEVGQHLPDWRTGTDYRSGVSARRELGGGVLLELSHELDYMRWIFGEVEWVSACLRRQSALEVDVEDSAHLLLGFEPTGERPGIFASVFLDFIRHDPVRNCTAIGTRGSLRWDGIEGSVKHYAAGSGEWREILRHTPERDESYAAEWQHLLACVAGIERPSPSGEDGLRVLEIIEAARRSSDTGARVRLGSGRRGAEAAA